MKPVYYKKNGVVNKVAGVSVPIPYPADDVSYDNTTSQLEATDVQSAIDELSQKEAGVQSDWNESDNTKLDYIKNKPTIPDAQIQSDWTQSDDTAKDFIKNKPTIPAAQIQSDWSQSDNTQLDFIKNKPSNLVQDASYVHTDNNYTSTEKTKLGTIDEGAEVNVQSDWNQTNTDADDFIKNKPTIPDAQIQSDWNQTSGTAKDFIKNKPTLGTASALDVATSGDASSLQVVKGDDSRLSDARTPVSHTHTLSEITDAGTAAAKDSTSSVTAGSTDLVESGAVKTAIDNAVSGAYKHAGTKTCAELISSLLIASNNGNVYNITDSGATTSDFIEGAGIPIRAGDNVGIAKISDSIYKFDLLSGFIDTSNFVTKSSTSGLIKNDGSIDTTEYAPASSIPAAQIQSDWSQSDNTKLDYIKNKPTLGTAAAKNVPTSGNASTSEVVLGNDSRLTDARNAADVYEWAKASTKPSYTKSEVGLGNADNTSDSTKKSNFTGSIASGNTGFVTGGDAYTALNGKVDKVDGKGLSSNDYTDTEKNKLAGIASGAEVNVQSDWNQTNTSSDDYIKNKPANLVQDASYVHTDNNYTTTEKNKLAGIASGAEVNVQSDWNQTTTGADDYIKNKPTKLSQFTNDSGFTKVESSTTNGNVKIDTVETQVYDDSEIQNLVDTSLTETEYANPLSLTTDNAQNAIDTKIKLLPIQDLHGYDKPWVGGAGKNLLPTTASSTTISGVTFTVNSDGTVIANASSAPSENAIFESSTAISLKSGAYIISGCPSGGSDSTYACSVPGKTADYGSGGNLTLTSDTTVNFRCIIYAGYKPTNLIFEPMICLSTATNPTTYEPYSNICPISGHDQINVLGCGKNLLPMTVEGIKAANTGGTWSGNVYTINGGTFMINMNNDGNIISITANGTFSSQTILNCTQSYAIDPTILKAGTYKFGCTSPLLSSTNRIRYRDPNGFFAIYSSVKERTYETDSWIECAIVIDAGTVSNLVFQPMIYFAIETDPTFEPYTESNNKTIVLPDTVYGGELDLESGELAVDRGFIKVNDVNWTLFNTSNWRSDSAIGAKMFEADEESHILCSHIPTMKQSYSTLERKITSLNWTTSVAIWNTGYTTESSLKQNIGEAEICYLLETPYTIQLTPSQLYLLKNQNNLNSSDYTKLKVVYRNGVFALLDPATETTDGLMSAMDKLKLDGIDSENISLDLLSHAIVLQRT